MSQIKDVVQDLKESANRRRVLLILTPILFLGLSIAAIYIIEPKYKSSTSILVQKDETLNPLVMYEMAVNMASDDMLESFNEIIYSRSTVEMLIDSLNLDDDIKSERERQALINTIPEKIQTVLRASGSFVISYYDTDPVRSRDAVQLLSDHFIKTRLRIENNRNEETVEFFNEKLGEIEAIVNQKSEQVLNTSSEQLGALPSEVEALQTRLQDINSNLDSIEWQIFQQEENLDIINEFLSQEEPSGNVQILYKLPLDEMALGGDLTSLLDEYDQLSQQYTESYPRLQTLESQITRIANRIPDRIQSNLRDLNLQKNDFMDQRKEIIADMQNSFVARQRVNSRQSDYSIYEGLYNEMKVKLEQAKMSQDIGNRAGEQFLVIDQPYVPEDPASPDKKLIISIGLLLGLVLGVVLSAVAEVMDSTLRKEEDLPYDKPIIAYLSKD